MGTIETQTIKDFTEFLKNDEKSEATAEKYLRDVSSFASYIGQGDISKESVIGYKRELIASGYAPRSINSMLAAINKFLDFTGRGECRVKPIKLQQQIYCPEEKELTREEFTRLALTARDTGNTRLYMLLLTVCATGIRVSELKYVTVEAAKQGSVSVSCKGKTRIIFIVSELQNKLLRYAAEQGLGTGCIFVTRSGRPMVRSNIWKEMKDLCGKANVDQAKVYPHNLRHLFARVFYDIDKDIAKLADTLGHSSINTTRIYIVSTGCEHRKIIEKMKLII